MKRRFSLLILASLFVLTFTNWTNDPSALPTSMKITVIDYLGNFIEGASIKLFHTEDDYRNETNQIGETVLSNSKGKATIKNLQPRVYYIYVTKGDLNNIGGGVQTDTLAEGKVNKLNIIIE